MGLFTAIPPMLPSCPISQTTGASCFSGQACHFLHPKVAPGSRSPKRTLTLVASVASREPQKLLSAHNPAITNVTGSRGRSLPVSGVGRRRLRDRHRGHHPDCRDTPKDEGAAKESGTVERCPPRSSRLPGGAVFDIGQAHRCTGVTPGRYG
jgi:hypothetical protein